MEAPQLLRTVESERRARAEAPRGTRRLARGRASVLVAALACAAGAAAQAPDASAPVPEPREDVQLLVDASLASARKTLAEQGDFHPFAFFMNPQGALQRLTPKADASLPEPDALVDLLQRAFRQRAEAGEARAIAVVADVVIAVPGGGESDALQIGIEHRSGWCRNLFYPFQRSEGGELLFGDEISGRRAGVVFPGCR